MNLTLPEELLRATRMTESEFRQELAIWLFQNERLTLSQASQLANMTLAEFQHLLASRRIPIHYDIAEFEEDIETLKGLSTDEGR